MKKIPLAKIREVIVGGTRLYSNWQLITCTHISMHIISRHGNVDLAKFELLALGWIVNLIRENDDDDNVLEMQNCSLLVIAVRDYFQ